jgi:hypothetical protein
MGNEAFPALFRRADTASNRYQREYLWLIQAEYALLFVASIISMSVFTGATIYVAFVVVLLLSLGVLVLRSVRKPEQDWYGCRALAESVKTLSWRFMMRAAPFADPAPASPKLAFREHLHDLFRKNQTIADRIDQDVPDGEQVTSDMERVRALSLDDRKRTYLKDRIEDQSGWYQRKAKFNKDAARRWAIIGVGAYVVAVAMALARIRFPDIQLWPIEPVLLFASSVIGWMQIKKFNELAATYSVAATELGLLKPKIEEAHTEAELSLAVSEAELAFSREHTLWIARRTQ